ncbi:uncharacterized protein EAE97_011476 [Botrytis byssoidea]|uniref:Uncharacterized protein n=1 Tax=Botrytis byssoidea TaxID=139641 RepID=A0A9P5LS44_9HELO|nr:uncharacterized protein EAE97_011476 [Botrytis byssoidea]KAF7920583.1 hypothetical protein EAE97_011476 [Botrytis byssoidea]
MDITKEKQQQPRAAKAQKGKKAVREERHATRAARGQAAPAAAPGVSFATPSANLPTEQELVFRPRVTLSNTASSSSFGTNPAPGSALAPSTTQVSQADNATPPTPNAYRAPFAARIAAVAARRPNGRHHKKSRVPSQKERLSRRAAFRELTSVPLAALGIGLNLGGAIAPDIVGNWPAEVLGDELLGSDDEEEDDMEDDDDEEMEDIQYDSDIYDSDGNEWAALGVNMKEGKPF